MLVHQEGERTILKLLDEYPNNNFNETPDISYFENKVFKSNKIYQD